MAEAMGGQGTGLGSSTSAGVAGGGDAVSVDEADGGWEAMAMGRTRRACCAVCYCVRAKRES